MESYEKKYKEALEVAKRKLCFDKAGMVDSFIPNDIYEMFPELKESDDERIRKALITAVSGTFKGNTLWHTDVTREEARAWLEKQGEQKFAEGTFVNVDDVREDFIQEVYRVLDADSTNDRANQIIDAFDNLPTVTIEKQGGQKPVDKVEPKFKVKYAGNEYNVFEVKDIAGVTYYGIEDEPNHIDYVQAENCERVDGYSIKESGSPFPTKPAKFSEQNSTWSEEDEAMLDDIIDFLEKGTVKLQHDLSLYASWLKSLKGRVGCEVNCTATKEWKPSDAQMIALNDVITNGHLSNANERILKGLQEQLKKLK